jgi:ACS family hexuronate transporter-like MFS transporter
MKTSWNKWTVCVLLFLATTLNYLDRQTLSILAPFLQKELSLNNEQLGWLFSVFYWSYTFAQFGIGAVLDRTHLRWMYGVGVLLWSLVAALTSLATGFASLIVFRLLLGLTEAVNWPAAMRTVARVLPPDQRSLGNGIFTSGTSIGALIAPSLILFIAHTMGWRAGFVVVGSFGALWFLLWILFTRQKELVPVWRATEPRTAGSSGTAYATILRSPQFWRVFVVAVLVNPCLYFNLNWLPTYFVQQRGMPPAQLSGMLTIIYLGLDLGYLFCGTAVLLLTKRGVSLAAARMSVFAIATAFLSCSALVPFAATVNQGVALLVASNFGAGCWIAMYLTMAQEVSESHVSTAAGLLGGSGSAAGALAMWAVGRVTNTTANFAAPMTAVAVAAVIAAIAGVAVVRHAPAVREARTIS